MQNYCDPKESWNLFCLAFAAEIAIKTEWAAHKGGGVDLQNQTLLPKDRL